MVKCPWDTTNQKDARRSRSYGNPWLALGEVEKALELAWRGLLPVLGVSPVTLFILGVCPVTMCVLGHISSPLWASRVSVPKWGLDFLVSSLYSLQHSVIDYASLWVLGSDKLNGWKEITFILDSRRLSWMFAILLCKAKNSRQVVRIWVTIIYGELLSASHCSFF